MPETPIDQSAGIQSIRLKIPTGTVPIPPDGYAQLHSPGPGELALRLPDGSVVEIGGGGGGGVATLLVGPGGTVDAQNTNPVVGVALNPLPGTAVEVARGAGTGAALFLVTVQALAGETVRMIEAVDTGALVFRTAGGLGTRLEVASDDPDAAFNLVEADETAFFINLNDDQNTAFVVRAGGSASRPLLRGGWNDVDEIQVGFAAGRVGFFGTTGVLRPVVPATLPTVQNVIDALVALGLVTQAD